jgi:hypothetical protein
MFKYNNITLIFAKEDLNARTVSFIKILRITNHKFSILVKTQEYEFMKCLQGHHCNMTVSTNHEDLWHKKIRRWNVFHEMGSKKAKQSSPATCHGGAWEEKKYSSYSFLTSALDGGEWSASRPGHALSRGKDPRYPLYRW